MKPDTPASPGLGDLGDDADKTRLPIDVPDPPDLRGARNLYSGAVPHRVGRYNIRHTIASGGMGTVYEATQDNPRRVVAVKVMKHGIASHSALRRFEFEAQLLARLHHPGIAQIFEAGTHDDGSGPVPYFAMEYIAGARPITAYATENKLSTRGRLELFTHVCDAVHHGHQRGIIHRDLKPSNILVDGQGEVKIIDFGVARGTDAELGFTTLQTDVGELIGTLQYMSPEQCAADPHDIDVRSDVYALGAVLYELLSSRLPYDVRGKSALEGTRIVREQEPLRLSAATSAEGPPTRELRGDVETIVVKALQKDRERRYQSALELVQDIRRYLSDEAIVARPPSLAYQFRIFARRHKALFGAGATVLVVLLAATMVSTSLYFRAERERLRTARAYDRLVLAERDTASVSGFFKDMLGTLDPDEPLAVRGQSPSTDMKVRELLESASERVKERFAGRPALEAEVRETLARAFFALGRFDEAEPQARQALRLRQDVAGPNDPDTRKAMEQLAGVLLHRGQINEGLTLRRAVLDSTRRTKGPNDRETLLQAERLAVALTACSRFAEAEALARDTNPQRAGLGSAASALQVAWLFHLSEMVNYQGRLREGEQLARDALDLAARSIGSNTQLAAYSKLILVDALREQGRLAEAEKVMREALADYRRLYGESHPWVDSCNMYLMRVLAQSGQLEEAETALRQSLERQRRELGDDSPYTLKTMIDLLRVLNRRGKFDQAEQLAEDLLPVVRRARGDESHHTVEVLHERSIALCGLGRIEEAEPIARDVVEASQRLFRTGYFHLPNFHDQWGQCLLDLRRYDQAEREFNLAYEGELAMRGPEHLNTREVVAHLVRLYETWGRPDDAARWRERMPAPSTPASGPADGPLH